MQHGAPQCTHGLIPSPQVCHIDVVQRAFLVFQRDSLACISHKHVDCECGHGKRVSDSSAGLCSRPPDEPPVVSPGVQNAAVSPDE